MRLVSASGWVVMGVVLGYLGCSAEETSDDDATNTPTTTSSSGVGGGTSTGTGATGGGGGGAPLTCPTPYTNVEGDCDLLAQDCAPEMACSVQGFSDPPVAQCMLFLGGVKPRGTECAAASECARGLACIDNRCSPVCCPATDEPCGGGQCDVHVGFSATHYAMFCSYGQACQLFAGDCPQEPVPTDCHVSDVDQGLAVCDERSSSFGGEGAPCDYRNDCGDSQRCNRSAPDDGICRYHCTVSAWESLTPGEGGCPSGQHCVDLGWNAFPDVGLCVLD